MNFEITSQLLEILMPFTENANIIVNTKNDNYCNQDSDSDFVILDEKNDVGFEVMENEIIVYYFTDHCHFEDYTSELTDGEDDYIQRAKEFLLELFNCKIRHIETYKGKTLSSEKYYMIYDDGREDAYIGGIWYGLSKLINPFRKKTRKISTWQFDISKGCFVNCEPKVFTPEAVEVIDISEGCYIEILEKNYAYTYNVMELYFDDYFGIYYWAPMINVQKSGFYDTKENAIISAKAVLKDNIQL